MAAPQQVYLRTPNGFYPPPDSIPLGGIISNPSIPDQPLIPDSHDLTPIDTEITRKTNNNYEFKAEKETGLNLDFSLGSQFLFSFGLGSQICDMLEFKNARVEWFNPSDDFVQNAVVNSNVVNYLEKNGYKKPIYVITGLMVGEDGRFEREVNRKSTLLQTGTSRNNTKSERERFDITAPGVFAFRLCEISCKPGGKKPTKKEYTKGSVIEWSP